MGVKEEAGGQPRSAPGYPGSANGEINSDGENQSKVKLVLHLFFALT